MIRKLFFLLLLLTTINSINSIYAIGPKRNIDSKILFEELGIKEINFEAFDKAITGYNLISDNKKEIITLIDFSRPSTEERLYVIDVKNRKLLFKTHVAHGRNSGANYATDFSNKSGSYKSSLGFYLTGETYQGKNGYSLKLDGLEKNFNDKARERAIVIHGAAYANPGNNQMDRLGRSLGCPALPTAVNKKVIDLIKDGSVLFIYATDQNYLQSSKYIISSNRTLKG